MKRCSNRMGLLRAVTVGALLTCAPYRASAQLPVTDVAGNAQWIQQTVTQIKSLAQQAQSYGTQLAQYQTALNQYSNMVTNTIALPQQVWSTVQGDIMRVQASVECVLVAVRQFRIADLPVTECTRLRQPGWKPCEYRRPD